MKFLFFLVWSLILTLSYSLGAFGFSQIVGTIKYFRAFRPAQALLIITMWAIILGFAAFAVIKWLNIYKTALYIGYGISFLLSLNTRPD